MFFSVTIIWKEVWIYTRTDYHDIECNDTYLIFNTNYLSTLLISTLHVFNSTNTLPLGICVFEQFEKLKFYYRRGNNSKVEVSVSDINGWRPPFPYSSDENSLEICDVVLLPVHEFSFPLSVERELSPATLFGMRSIVCTLQNFVFVKVKMSWTTFCSISQSIFLENKIEFHINECCYNNTFLVSYELCKFQYIFKIFVLTYFTWTVISLDSVQIGEVWIVLYKYLRSISGGIVCRSCKWMTNWYM